MDCLFCKIAKGELPCHKVYEDNEYLAFLDIFPNTDGMTLVIPKQHYASYAFKMDDDSYSKLLLCAKRVASQLDKRLNVKRTAMVMEGLGVDHAHIKLYPIYGLEKEFEETWAKEKVFFDHYRGYISTQLGERADDAKLAAIAKKLRGPV